MNGVLTVNRFSGVESWEITQGAFSIIKLPNCFLFNIWGKSNGTRLLPPIEEGYDAEPVFELQTCLNEDELIDIHTKGIQISSEKVNSFDERAFLKLYYYGNIEVFSCNIRISLQANGKYQVLASCIAEDVVHVTAKPNCELKIDCQVLQSKKKTGYWT